MTITPYMNHIHLNADGPSATLTSKGILSSRGLKATTFRNNDYIDQLNQILKGELAAVDAYQQSSLEYKSLENFCQDHKTCGRRLVQLIISNRGLPIDRSTLRSSLTTAVLQVAGVMPHWLNEKTTLTTFARIESHQSQALRKALAMAPYRDREALQAILNDSEHRLGIIDQL